MDPRLGVAAPGGAATMSSLAAFRIDARVSSAPNNRSLTYCLYRHPPETDRPDSAALDQGRGRAGRNYLYRVEACTADHQPTIPERVNLWYPLALREMTSHERDFILSGFCVQ